MLTKIRHSVRRLLVVLRRFNARGFRPVFALTVALPAAVFHRLYAKMAYSVNRSLLKDMNQRRFRAFAADTRSVDPPLRYFLIVMPRTLHFLLPCLELLPRQLPVTLVANGAYRWELAILGSRFSHRSLVRFSTLPNSSFAHGDMIDIMLRGVDEPFGILDHDLYVFDPAFLPSLRPRARECMVGAIGGINGRTGLVYPLTHLLVFNTPLLRDLMRRYRVSARIYRKLPAQAKAKLAPLGLRDGAPFKDYHDFFDTLHVLLGLAYAEGAPPRIERALKPSDIDHIGGTSVGVHHTKELEDLYVHARFLDLCEDPEIRKRYAYLIAPFSSSKQIRERIPMTPDVAAMLDAADALVDRLRLSLSALTGVKTPVRERE